MASGNTHDKATIALAVVIATSNPVIGPALIQLLNESQTVIEISYTPLLGFAISAGALLNLWLSPDLDLSKCNALRRWGPIGFIWHPYRKVIPHRHALSHLPVLGTMGRVFYLAVPVSPFFGLEWLGSEWLQAGIVGLILADILHWIFDGLPLRI